MIGYTLSTWARVADTSYFVSRMIMPRFSVIHSMIRRRLNVPERAGLVTIDLGLYISVVRRRFLTDVHCCSES